MCTAEANFIFSYLFFFSVCQLYEIIHFNCMCQAVLYSAMQKKPEKKAVCMQHALNIECVLGPMLKKKKK